MGQRTGPWNRGQGNGREDRATGRTRMHAYAYICMHANHQMIWGTGCARHVARPWDIGQGHSTSPSNARTREPGPPIWTTYLKLHENRVVWPGNALNWSAPRCHSICRGRFAIWPYGSRVRGAHRPPPRPQDQPPE